MPHVVAQVHLNVEFLIKLSTFTEDTAELPKCSHISICDAALKDTQVLSIDAEPAKARSLHKEDRATSHLSTKAMKKEALSVRADELPLPELD